MTQEEKKNALLALENMKARMQNGEISDFRMVIRNQQRTTHSDSELVSGRAKELKDKGYQEITLLGQNVNAYGKELENELSFAELLSK